MMIVPGKNFDQMPVVIDTLGKNNRYFAAKSDKMEMFDVIMRHFVWRL